MRKNNPAILSIFGFGILAVFSIINYGAIFANKCFFQMSWLYCDAETGLSQKIIGLLVIIFSFSGLIASVYYYFTKPEAALKKMALTSILLAFFIIPFGSSDFTYYFSAGKELSEGKNIYQEDWKRENVFQAGIPGNLVDGFQYGPITAYVFSSIYQFTTGNIFYFTVVLKIVNTLFVLLCAFLIFKISAYLNPVESKTLGYLWVVQPLVLFESVSNVHFDAWWLFFVLFAVLLAIHDKWWSVFPVLFTALWVKYVPVILLPIFALWFWQILNRKNWKKWIFELVIGVCLSLIITILSWKGYWAGKEVFSSLILQSKWAVMSVFASVYYTLLPVAKWTFSTNAHWWLTRAVHGFLFVVFVYYLFPILLQSIKILIRKLEWPPVNYLKTLFVFFSIYILVWQKSIWPWYLIWPATLGLIALQNNSGYPKKIVQWMFASPLVFYLVWYFYQIFSGKDAAGEVWFSHIIVVAVVVYPLYLLYRWRKENYGLVLLSENKVK